MRIISALLAAIVACLAAIYLVGLVAGLFFQVNAPTDPMQNAEAAAAALGSAPVGAQILLALSWLAGGFAAVAAARAVGRVAWPGWAVAGCLALLLATTFLIPLPLWLQAAAVVGPLLGALVADRLVGRRAAADGAAAGARA
jgi:hypothetical protein